MHSELRYLLEQAETDTEVRTVIITGTGNDFCVGADSQALEGHIEKGGYDSGTGPELSRPGYGVVPQFDQNFAFMFGLNVTTIAAVNGAAAGVGLVLACYCDLRFAANNAKLTAAPWATWPTSRIRTVLALTETGRPKSSQRPFAFEQGGSGPRYRWMGSIQRSSRTRRFIASRPYLRSRPWRARCSLGSKDD